jgi:hypothetical protein
VTRVHQSSEAPVSPELARKYIQRLLRDGVMDFQMAAFQLEAIDAAASSGRPILMVKDFEPERAERRLTHAA